MRGKGWHHDGGYPLPRIGCANERDDIMCGLSGFQIEGMSKSDRALLVWMLGDGIDRRGGHAIGFVSVEPNGAQHVHRACGRWGDARTPFIMRAATGSTVMMHARYATCGAADDPNNAHPFTIKRGGKTVLHGMHNGVLYNARDFARANGRDYTVDSRELFELLGDEKIEDIGKIDGYGVIVWYEPARPGVVHLCRISDDGELAVAKIKGGGIVWASTSKILKDALVACGMEVDMMYEVKPGHVHTVENGQLWITERKIEINKYRAPRSTSIFSRSWLDDSWLKDEFLFDDDRDAALAAWDDADDEEVKRLEMLDEEENALKIELCQQYCIDPKEVADMTYSEVMNLVQQWIA
jgi:hypothetical protein